MLEYAIEQSIRPATPVLSVIRHTTFGILASSILRVRVVVRAWRKGGLGSRTAVMGRVSHVRISPEKRKTSRVQPDGSTIRPPLGGLVFLG